MGQGFQRRQLLLLVLSHGTLRGFYVLPLELEWIDLIVNLNRFDSEWLNIVFGHLTGEAVVVSSLVVFDVSGQQSRITNMGILKDVF